MQQILKSAQTILVIDWPTKDVPETLARAGFEVVVHGGPGPEDYTAYEVRDGSVQVRHTGRPPEHADIVYSYRPLNELPNAIATAKAAGAKVIWTQSGKNVHGESDPQGCWVPPQELEAAREMVQAAGLLYVSEPYIADMAREVSGPA